MPSVVEVERHRFLDAVVVMAGVREISRTDGIGLEGWSITINYFIFSKTWSHS